MLYPLRTSSQRLSVMTVLNDILSSAVILLRGKPAKLSTPLFLKFSLLTHPYMPPMCLGMLAKLSGAQALV